MRDRFAEVFVWFLGAGDRTRTGDILLGNQIRHFPHESTPLPFVIQFSHEIKGSWGTHESHVDEC